MPWSRAMAYRRNGHPRKSCNGQIDPYNVVPPSDVCWFINPMNTIVISTINHSEIGVMFTNLAIVWGPHFVHDCAIFGVHVGKYSCMEHLGMVGRMFHIGEWIRMGCD